MKSMRYVKRNGGFSLGFAVPMSMLLLFSSLAYLKWQVADQQNAIHQVAATQAYYVAQAAIIQVPLGYMRNARPGFSPTAEIRFADGVVAGFQNARYLRPLISYRTQAGTQAGSLIQRRDYLLSATGVVRFTNYQHETQQVRRRAQLLLRKREFSQYFYFTDEEQTRFGEYIWFWSRDSIYSPVHANSNIGVHAGAYFGALVTTTGEIQSPQGSTFAGFPRPGYFQHVKKIPIPVKADRLRTSAAAGGRWLNSSDKQYTHGLWFNGTTATLWRWRTGTRSPYLDMSQAVGAVTWAPSREFAIFCDGDLWICGQVYGLVGIGAYGNLRLYDNITYQDGQCSQLPYRVNPNTHSMMTLISEVDEPPDNDRRAPWTGILMGDTPYNGRANGRQYGQSDQAHRDIAIHGQIFALNSSFTFEDQNDSTDAYIGPNPDERGAIYLTGAVCQHRRGYVHRSNRGGTGYDKVYQFDPRWDKTKVSVVSYPPFQMDLTSEGFLKWDVMGWQDLERKRGDEQAE